MKQASYIVYCCTLPNGKMYIGMSSKTLEERKTKHYQASRRYVFQNALRLNKGKEVWQVLFSNLTKGEAIEKEISTIALWETMSPKGYNLTPGGENGPAIKGVKKGPHTEETKSKIGRAHKGMKRPDGTGAKISAKLLGRSNPASAIPHTLEEKIVNARIKFGLNKVLTVYTEDGFSKDYTSPYEAGLDLNLKPRCITTRITKNSKSNSLFQYKFKVTEK